jgi:hypothetical protein
VDVPGVGDSESLRQLKMCWRRSLGWIFETALREALEEPLLTRSHCLLFALKRFPTGLKTA